MVIYLARSLWGWTDPELSPQSSQGLVYHSPWGTGVGVGNGVWGQEGGKPIRPETSLLTEEFSSGPRL